MGRPRRSPEQRIEEMPEEARFDLLWAKKQHEDKARELEAARAQLGEAIAKTVKTHHTSIRDMAALLEMPHQTVHALYVDAGSTRRAKPRDVELAKRANELAKDAA